MQLLIPIIADKRSSDMIIWWNISRKNRREKVNKARTTEKCNFGTFYVNRRREIGTRDSYVW